MAYKGKIAKGTSSLYKKKGYGKNAVFMKTGDKDITIKVKPDEEGLKQQYLEYRQSMADRVEAGESIEKIKSFAEWKASLA
tara:strand:+ start:297 stop:539 length:243 start_codon:yes stop_codon:yes gene_type:complete